MQLDPLPSSALPGRWYCVAILSNLERMAEAGLKGLGMGTLFPQVASPLPHAAWKIRSLFPGYAFVSFSTDTDPWHRIADVPGVYRLFKHGPYSPTPLPIGAIEDIQAAADGFGVIYPPEAAPVRPGSLCRLLNGAFANLTGICRWSDGERVKLLMNLLGGQTTVTVAATSVEVVA